MEHDEAVKYYNVFDVCVYPRRACELYELKSSFKVVEAMANGKAVISTNLKAINEIIIDRENGLLVEPNDINGLFDKIKSVMMDDNLKVLLEENALEYIKNNDIDIDSVCEKMGYVYDGMNDMDDKNIIKNDIIKNDDINKNYDDDINKNYDDDINKNYINDNEDDDVNDIIENGCGDVISDEEN
jgi:hypothetical protein